MFGNVKEMHVIFVWLNTKKCSQNIKWSTFFFSCWMLVECLCNQMLAMWPISTLVLVPLPSYYLIDVERFLFFCCLYFSFQSFNAKWIWLFIMACFVASHNFPTMHRKHLFTSCSNAELQCPPFRLSYQGLGEPLCFAAFGPFATTAFYLLQGSTRLNNLTKLPWFWI